MPELVDCERLAEQGAVLVRDFSFEEMPRLRDLLADLSGSIRATFAFRPLTGGRAGATVEVRAAARLVCQRCLCDFSLPVNVASDVVFVQAGELAEDGTTEWVETAQGCVALCDVAEDEMLLALPIVPKCLKPESCGNAPAEAAEPACASTAAVRRPLAGLSELLLKRD